ncbi:hypothetical protein M0R45_007957 [Rubus argutus]|uniref:Leucine-rich repeat domain, L domain-containing protein n=1 Tax=Rubus argutus TaxID=59490 RepID=A0AAW1XZT7_RUBAR
MNLSPKLITLDCASTLQTFHLSGSNIISPLKCLRELVFWDCWNLVDIPQLPPHIKSLEVQNCVSLERISKLSKILEGEESQMIEAMNLTNCRRLIENLVKEANVVVNDDCEAVEALFRLFLSCQKSKFAIKFPGSEIPKWFSCQMDFQGLRRFEFFIEILPNFKWENTGLALCVLKQQSDDHMFCKFDFFIYINEVEVKVLPKDRDLRYVDSRLDHLVLHYIPFLDMCRLHYVPPFMCRVIIFNDMEGTECKIISTDAKLENQ